MRSSNERAVSRDVRSFAREPEPSAGLEPGTHRMLVRDLVLACLIGVHRHERDGKQRVRVNLDLIVADPPEPLADRLADVVSYEDLVLRLRALAEAGHVNLLETLAERVAALCLAEPRVRRARVRVEKLDVFADAESVGIEIEREKARIR